MGGWRWGGFGETRTEVLNYPVGALVLDMYDAHNRQLIWRGVATQSLSDKPEKSEQKLDKAVNKMLDHFPPQRLTTSWLLADLLESGSTLASVIGCWSERLY